MYTNYLNLNLLTKVKILKINFFFSIFQTNWSQRVRLTLSKCVIPTRYCPESLTALILQNKRKHNEDKFFLLFFLMWNLIWCKCLPMRSTTSSKMCQEIELTSITYVLLQKVLSCTLFSCIWIAFRPNPHWGSLQCSPYQLAVESKH